MSDLLGGEKWDMGEKLGWHRSMETAKPHQLLRPCFEQRVGPDGLHIVPAVKCLPRVKPNPDLSRQHQSWREERWRQSHGHPGGTAGKGMLHCNPSQEEVAPLPSGAVGSRNSRGWGWPDLISPLCFLPREAQQVLKASTNGGEKKRSCVKKLWHRAQPIRSRTSALWMVFWQGIRASFC